MENYTPLDEVSVPELKDYGYNYLLLGKGILADTKLLDPYKGSLGYAVREAIPLVEKPEQVSSGYVCMKIDDPATFETVMNGKDLYHFKNDYLDYNEYLREDSEYIRMNFDLIQTLRDKGYKFMVPGGIVERELFKAPTSKDDGPLMFEWTPYSHNPENAEQCFAIDSEEFLEQFGGEFDILIQKKFLQ